jgi:DNA-binding NarL/FixJ family response regulator
MKILLVDSDAVVRCGLKAVLQPLRNVTICGEVANGVEGIRQSHELKPDVVISEFRLPGADGAILTRRILKVHPEQKILIFDCVESGSDIRRLLLAGIEGLVSKADPVSELVNALDAFENNRTYFTTAIENAMSSEFLHPVPASEGPNSLPASEGPHCPRLTLRELEVAQLLAEGKVTKEIATILGTTTSTAATHRTNVMRKLGAHNLAQMTLKAIAEGIINVPRFTLDPRAVIGGKTQSVADENVAKAAA